MDELSLLTHLGIALGLGLMIGLERGWRTREEPAGHRVAGIRTYGILGLLGGIAGLLSKNPGPAVTAIAAFGVVAAILLGYRAALKTFRNNVSVTATLTAILTFLLGMLATLGYPTIAVAAAAVTVLLLAMREPLHSWLATLDATDIQATARYGIIALVVLPLLPDQAYGPYAAWNPRSLWLVVVLITGLSFAGYIAGKRLGPARGTIAAAAVAATVSSTAVISELSRRLRDPAEDAGTLKAGIAAASAVMFVRVTVLTAVLAQPALPVFALTISVATLVAGVWALLLARRAIGTKTGNLPVRNPFDLLPAIGFAAIVGIMVLASRWAITRFGDAGLATLLGLTGLYDVDSAIITVANLPKGVIAPESAGLLLALPMIVNTLVKAVIAVMFAGPRRGWSAALPLFAAAMAATAGAGAVWAAV